MSEKGDDVENTIANDLVVTKYKVASEIVNKALAAVVEKAAPDVSVMELCELGDKIIIGETSNVFKKEKEMRRGIAFPTSISINNCICHYSPAKSDPDVKLKNGDLIKIDMGGHIDGFIAVVAHSLIVGATKENPATGPAADALVAAHQAASVALRLVVPGGENDSVTDAVQKVAESYNCKPVSGMLSHELKQFRIDGDKTIIQNPTEAQKKNHEKCEFEVNEVYAVDVIVSTGEGKGREIDNKATIYKKTDEIYQLKMKASRSVLSDVDKKFGVMPFTLRYFDDEVKAKMGLKECLNHKLIEPFPLLHEKEGEFVAQFKFTVLLMPTRSHKITGLPVDLSMYKTEHKIKDKSIVELLQGSNPTANKKKKKKAAKKAVDGAVAPAAAEAKPETKTTEPTTKTTEPAPAPTKASKTTTTATTKAAKTKAS
jgi:curved DNA binding protein